MSPDSSGSSRSLPLRFAQGYGSGQALTFSHRGRRDYDASIFSYFVVSTAIDMRDCYQNGKFTAPDLTVEQMVAMVKGKMREMKVPESGIEILARDIPKLKRWQKK